MKKSILQSVIILITVTFVMFQSCEKKKIATEISEETVEQKKPTTIDISTIEMEGNMLNFKNEDEYFNAIQTLSEMTEEELDKWENNMGFYSLRTRINNAMDDIDNAQTKEEYQSLLDKYNDIIEINAENSVRPIITDLIYTSITNEYGIYKTDKVLNKLTREHIVSASIEDYNTLVNIKFTDNDFDNNLKSQKYIENSSDKAYCGTSHSAYKQYDKRRVFVTASKHQYTFWYNNSRSYYFKVYMYGEKKNIWGNWKSYKTYLNFKDTRAKFYYPVFYIPGGWHYYTYNFSNWSGNTSSDAKSLTKYKYMGKTASSNHSIPYAYFKAIECKASSRGVGDRWAHIKCGY